jgi:hypothetical protein
VVGLYQVGQAVVMRLDLRYRGLHEAIKVAHLVSISLLKLFKRKQSLLGCLGNRNSRLALLQKSLVILNHVYWFFAHLEVALKINSVGKHMILVGLVRVLNLIIILLYFVDGLVHSERACLAIYEELSVVETTGVAGGRGVGQVEVLSGF